MTTTFTYDALLRPRQAVTQNGATLTTLNYKYDESGGGLLREREVVGGTKIRFHWEGLNLYMEEEWNGRAWIPKRTYINQPSALGGTLARFDLGTSNTLDTSDNGWFYHYDEAGNVILITDKNGGLIKHFEQDAWGNDLNGTFSTTQNIRQHQTGKYLDEATGLYFFGARWYDPAIGRFISVSPLSPLGEEEYVYCSENPVNSADVNGLWNLWNPATWLEPNALEWTLLNSINPFHPSSGIIWIQWGSRHRKDYELLLTVLYQVWIHLKTIIQIIVEIMIMYISGVIGLAVSPEILKCNLLYQQVC